MNCYLPDHLKARAEIELPVTVSFSEILRRGVLSVLDGGQAGAQSDEAPVGADSGRGAA